MPKTSKVILRLNLKVKTSMTSRDMLNQNQGNQYITFNIVRMHWICNILVAFVIFYREIISTDGCLFNIVMFILHRSYMSSS